MNNGEENTVHNRETKSGKSIDQKEKKGGLLSVDNKGRTCLHRACYSGDKEEVLKVLAQIQAGGALKAELLRQDKSGRTPLCLAQADQEQLWWGDESDESYQARAATATATLTWIETNANYMVDEVKRW